MQYLVNMTTHVPDGTSAEDVRELRSREAARARELAADGYLLRLWRPPLKPGEWRTLGLFEADDDGGLEEVLASMPLRVWRSDDVTPLTPHSNDPGATRKRTEGGAEFLTTFVLAVPRGTPSEEVDEAMAREANRARQLAEEGRLVRLWTLPGPGRALGLYRAHDLAEMEAIIEALPLKSMMTTEITPLTAHPNDPGESAGHWCSRPRTSPLGMLPRAMLLIAAVSIAGTVASAPMAAHKDLAPRFRIELPAGYREWKLISVAHEAGDLNDLRAILGNDVAIKAYRAGKHPFPDGAIIARLAWAYVPSEVNNEVFGREQSFVAGAPTNVQFMIKDSRRFASTGGWGFAQFKNGQVAADEATLETCFPCHAPVKARDFVFTQFAPTP